MNKHAAEKIASEYYNLGLQLALQNAGLIKTAEPEYTSDRSPYHLALRDHFDNQAMMEEGINYVPLDPEKYTDFPIDTAIARKYDMSMGDIERLGDRLDERRTQLHGYGQGPDALPISFNALTGNHTPVVDRTHEGVYADLPPIAELEGRGGRSFDATPIAAKGPNVGRRGGWRPARRIIPATPKGKRNSSAQPGAPRFQEPVAAKGPNVGRRGGPSSAQRIRAATPKRAR